MDGDGGGSSAEEASGERTAAELGPCWCVSVVSARPWLSSSRRSRLVNEEGMRKAKQRMKWMEWTDVMDEDLFLKNSLLSYDFCDRWMMNR